MADNPENSRDGNLDPFYVDPETWEKRMEERSAAIQEGFKTAGDDVRAQVAVVLRGGQPPLRWRPGPNQEGTFDYE